MEPQIDELAWFLLKGKNMFEVCVRKKIYFIQWCTEPTGWDSTCTHTSTCTFCVCRACLLVCCHACALSQPCALLQTSALGITVLPQRGLPTRWLVSLGRFSTKELNDIGPLASQFLSRPHGRSVETSKHTYGTDVRSCLCFVLTAMCSVEEQPIRETSIQSTCLCVGRIRWKSQSLSPALSLKLRQPRRPDWLQNRAESPQCFARLPRCSSMEMTSAVRPFRATSRTTQWPSIRFPSPTHTNSLSQAKRQLNICEVEKRNDLTLFTRWLSFTHSAEDIFSSNTHMCFTIQRAEDRERRGTMRKLKPQMQRGQWHANTNVFEFLQEQVSRTSQLFAQKTFVLVYVWGFWLKRRNVSGARTWESEVMLTGTNATTNTLFLWNPLHLWRGVCVRVCTCVCVCVAEIGLVDNCRLFASNAENVISGHQDLSYCCHQQNNWIDMWVDSGDTHCGPQHHNHRIFFHGHAEQVNHWGGNPAEEVRGRQGYNLDYQTNLWLFLWHRMFQTLLWSVKACVQLNVRCENSKHETNLQGDSDQHNHLDHDNLVAWINKGRTENW